MTREELDKAAAALGYEKVDDQWYVHTASGMRTSAYDLRERIAPPRVHPKSDVARGVRTAPGRGRRR